MKSDDEIRAGLRELADTTTVSPDAWARINERLESAPPRRPWQSVRPLIALAAAAAVVLVAIGVSQRRTSTDTAYSGDPVRGTVYAFGIYARLDDVVRIDLADGRSERLNANAQNYANAVVVDGTVYVAGGCQPGEGELLRLEGADYTPVERDASARTLPACSVGPGPHGTLLWVSQAAPFEGPWAVHQWDPRTSSDRVVHESETPLAAVAAGPGGDLALVEGELSSFSTELTLAVKRVDGRIERHRLRTELAETLEGSPQPVVSWGANGFVAVAAPLGEGRDGDDAPSTVVVDTTNGRVVRKVIGWAGTAWSPDGRSLLLSGGEAPSRLAVLRAPSFKLEVLPQRTHGRQIGRPLVWLEEEPAGRPPPVVDVAAGTTNGESWSVSTYRDPAGRGCLQLRSQSGAGRFRCEAPTAPSYGDITAITSLGLGSRSDTYLLTALVAPDGRPVTATFLDGSTAAVEVVPVTVGDKPFGLVVLAATQPVVRLAAGGTVLTCEPLPATAPAAEACVVLRGHV